MKTFIKSVFHSNIGLSCLQKPVRKNEIVEVPTAIADKLLTRTVWNEELEKDVNVWEKSTAKAYEEQKGQVAEEPVAPEAGKVPAQQTQNTNETTEHLNDAPDTADTAKGRQAAPPTNMRLSSEGENDTPPAAPAPAASTEPAAPAAPAAKKPAVAKAKPAAAAPAAAKAPARQRKAPTK